MTAHIEQSKTISFVETCVNVGTGFFVSLLVWYAIIIPVWHPGLTHLENISVTLVFTVVAIIRGYVIRRFFATKIHAWAIKISEESL